MALEADQILDRRRLKRRLGLWRVIAIVALVALVVGAIGRATVLPDRNYVARLSVDGIILDDPWRDAALESDAKKAKAKALIVRIDSPGGTMVGGESLYRSLRAVASHKPVVAVVGELATSAGYLTALGADHIVARAGSVTGSIGVMLQTADITGLLEKIGIKPEAIKSRSLKSQPNPLEPLTAEARAAAKAVVLDLFELFVDIVADRRQMPREGALELADGRVFSGRQALANGLIDELGGEPEARKWLDESRGVATALPVKDVRIKREDEIWREFVPDLVGKALFSERLRLDGVVSLWHPDL